MDERDKEVIRRMYVRLGRNLEATKLMGYLYQEHVLNEEDMDDIRTKSTAKKKAEKLLKILKKRKNGLKMLIKALLVTETQAFLGHELLERVSWSEQEIEIFTLELEGKVDPCQLLQANLAVLKQKNSALISKLSEYELKFNLLEEEKLVLKERVQEKNPPYWGIVMTGSQQWFKIKLWRPKRRGKSDLNKEATDDGILQEKANVQTDQGCQTMTSLTGDLPLSGINTIHDDLGINWADAGRRWSDSVYAVKRHNSKTNRRRSFNDAISRSSTSLKNAILGAFGKRHGIMEHKTTPDSNSSDDDCSDTCSRSTDLTTLA